jgi:hypothetical protein
MSNLHSAEVMLLPSITCDSMGPSRCSVIAAVAPLLHFRLIVASSRVGCCLFARSVSVSYIWLSATSNLDPRLTALSSTPQIGLMIAR